MHSISANGAHFAANRVNPGQTIGTDGEPGDVQQGLAANAAVGRKQNGEETLSSPVDPSSVNPKLVNPDSSKAG